MALTETEEVELLELLEQDERESVVPLLEQWRKPARFKMAYGGRGSGKSRAAASLLVQRANHEQIKVLCAREIQKSIEESVYALILDTVKHLRYPGWIFKKDEIVSPAGSRFVFRGLKDLRASQQIKSYEGFDVIWVEEAATVSGDSWKIIVPTFRKEGSEIWATFNRDEEMDPVYERFCARPRRNSIVVEVNWHDNPWFPDILRAEMEQDYERDPDEAEHIWGGQPRKQGMKSVMARSRIRAAMDRVIDAIGGRSVGVDVARFGDDKTDMYMRQGLKVTKHKELAKTSIPEVVRQVWDFVGRDPSIPIKVDDTGVGGGVTDGLRELGAKVVAINFGGRSTNPNLYDTIADEMWFTFPVDDADIPDDAELMKELAGRQYDYDKKNRRKVEPKKKFKERYGKSPDRADALLLTFYEGMTIQMTDKHREQLRARRGVTR